MKLLNKKKTLLLLFVSSLCCSTQAQIIYIDDSGNKQTADGNNFVKNKNAHYALTPVPVKNIRLLPSLFNDRYSLNRSYMMSLDNYKLLQNFYNEAGSEKTRDVMVNKDGKLDGTYWGWESPNCQLRGHFLGHWLSAAAYMYAETGDESVKQKAEQIVTELAECQRLNGGEWVGSIPTKYLYLMANGENVWSPQYTLHKTLMGLYDMYKITGSKKAFEVLDSAANWFHKWTQEMKDAGKASVIYGGETSGMLEIWAAMYGETNDKKYLDLMQCYGSPYIFSQLEKGEDALSCNHANASIPWSHGAARMYEVTGNDYWKNLTLAFWKCATKARESFCTGGQNAGEHWIPKGEIANFVGENNQEHCTVYNMMRTADYLYRWTGDMTYADYIERNLYNGILAQQHPSTGMVAYFLPMAAGYTKGGEKGWGHPTMDFYCCHGSLVQAQTRYMEYIYYQSTKGLTISQYIPSEAKWNFNGTDVNVKQVFAAQDWDNKYNASRWRMRININTTSPAKFDLTLRLPWWLKQKAIIKINGETQKVDKVNGSITLSRTWNNDEIYLEFPTRLYCEKLPGTDNTVAFMEGPIVLAGVTDEEIALKGNYNDPTSLLQPLYNQEYKAIRWTKSHYKTKNQSHDIQLIPLYEVGDEKYEIYFPVIK